MLVQVEGQAVDKKRRFYVATETLKDAHEGAVFQLSESETKHALRSSPDLLNVQSCLIAARSSAHNRV